MAETKNKKVNAIKKHEKELYTYPDGTTLVYYEQNLNKCTDVTIGFRIPRLDVPRKDEIIGVYKNKLVFYQGLDDLVRIPLIKPGLPHFVEHMIYSSLQSIPKEKIFDYFVRTNTQYNAFTTQDTLAAEFNCPSKFNDQIFSLFSEMIFRNQYDEKDLENEKKPVYQELQRTIDENRHNSITDILFDDSSVLTGEEILGCDKKIIQSFDQKQMLKFINSYFTKQNMIISVVSDRPFAEIKALCDKYFIEKAPSNQATEVRTPQPSYSFNRDELLLLPDKTAKTSNISFILKGIPDYEQNEIYSTVEDFILNNFNGRLMKKLRNENGKVYTPYFADENLPGLSLKILEAQTTPNNVKSVLETMTDILADFANNGITDAEFEGFKQMWANRRERAVSVKHNKSYNLYNKVLNGLKPFVGEYNKKISELTKEDIDAYLKETYSHARCCLMIDGNFDEKSIKPFEEILKFRPLDRYMEDVYKDKELNQEFYDFLINASDDEYAKKIKYVMDDHFKNFMEAKKQKGEEQKTEEENKKWVWYSLFLLNKIILLLNLHCDIHLEHRHYSQNRLTFFEKLYIAHLISQHSFVAPNQHQHSKMLILLPPKHL